MAVSGSSCDPTPNPPLVPVFAEPTPLIRKLRRHVDLPVNPGLHAHAKGAAHA